MAPTPSPIPVHSLNHPSGRHLRRFRHQGMNPPRHPSRTPLGPRIEQLKARSLDAALQPLAVRNNPSPPPIIPSSSTSVVLAPEPSVIPNNQPQVPTDIPGNIVAAVVVVVLILGGLIGLVVGGEMLRRRTRAEGKRVSRPPSRCSGGRKSELIKHTTGSPYQRASMACDEFLYDEKTWTGLARPPPVLNRERQRRLSDVWPIRSFSMAVSNRLSCPVQVEHSLQRSLPMINPHTTWSEFSPVSPYVAPPRTVLTCIPEELEDSRSHTNSDLETILGITFQRSLEPGSAVPISQTKESKSSQNMLRNPFNGPESSTITEQRGLQDRQVIYKRATSDDCKSSGSSAPDMTSDGGESSRSSMVSLESLEDENDGVFELRRAQTRSMQMNKGVLLSLSLKDLDDDSQDSESTHEECGPSRSASSANGDKNYGVESLVMLGGNFSAVNLDEFPSPPSILPMIPSFVSGF